MHAFEVGRVTREVYTSIVLKWVVATLYGLGAIKTGSSLQLSHFQLKHWRYTCTRVQLSYLWTRSPDSVYIYAYYLNVQQFENETNSNTNRRDEAL